jgi:uncharacterized iron-regulated membrane protein
MFQKIRKIVFWGHLSAGVVAGLFILNMAVSGIILSFEPQIVDWAEGPARRAAPIVVDAEPMKLGAVIAAASQNAGAKVPTLVALRPGPNASLRIGFKDGYVYADPYTGKILGRESKIHQTLHEVEEWHRWLANKKIGKPITGAVAFIFFFMILGGLVLWWPKQLKAAAFQAVLFFNSRLSGKARDFNWHNVIGFWCAPLLLITTTTGLVMSYGWAANALYRITGNEPPAQNRPQANAATAPSVDAPPINWDAVAAAARKKQPGWISIQFRWPPAGGPVTAIIEEPSSWGPKRRSQLTLDPATGAEKKWEPAADYNSGRKLRMWMAPLHTGRAFGAPGQFVMALSALGAAVLVWTGLALTWRRFRARK